MAPQVTIRVELTETVEEKSKDWLLQSDGGKFDYVETILPKTKTTVLLLQTLPLDQFDLKKAIQALNGL